MASDSERIHEHAIKVGILQSDIEHLSDRLDKLCDQIDNKVCVQIENNLLILEKINARMQEEMIHRISYEKSITKLTEDILHISYIQKSNEKKIVAHEEDISRLKDAEKEKKTIIAASKVWWKAIGATVSFCFMIGSGAYTFIETQKASREEKMAVIMQEIDENKRKLEYTREKYLIRNGKLKDG